jgi:hypothetical protein
VSNPIFPKQHWIIRAGTFSGILVLALLACGAIFLLITGQMTWRAAFGMAFIALFIYFVIRELRRPE